MSEPAGVPRDRPAPSVDGTRRLLSIDACRGLAALGVVICHSTNRTPFEGIERTSRFVGTPVAYLLTYGFVGVYLFFVLSGFCIHMPWAREVAAGRAPHLDFFAFWKRRFWRLYPPYFIAGACYLVLLAVEGRLPQPFGYQLGMHLVMVHNLDYRTTHTFSAVFWTLAVEEQLYLAYFLLLWLRNRLGWVRTLAVCLAARGAWFALAALVHRRFGVAIPVTEAAAPHWAEWALGAVSVEAALGIIKLPSWARDPRLGVALLVSAGSLLYVDWFGDQSTTLHKISWFVIHPIWGAGFFLLLNHLVCRERSWAPGKAPRLISLAAGVGLFSYSLYLTHDLFFGHLTYWLERLAVIPPSWMPPLTLFVLAPLSVPFAWLFFQAFERPFLNRQRALRSPSHPDGGVKPAGNRRGLAGSGDEAGGSGVVPL